MMVNTNTIRWLRGVLTLSCLVLLVACNDKEPLAPVAAFTVNSHVTYANRAITVDASPSSDPDGENFNLQVRWDFEDDGIWDTDYSTDKQFNWLFKEHGYHKIRVEVKDHDNQTNQAVDSILVFGPFPDSVMTDPRDGQQYRIVKTNGIWFMAEDLRYGTRISSSVKQSDNQIVEYYAYDDDPKNLSVYGGMYSQAEAMNYKMQTNNQGICPPGWRIPDQADWDLIDFKNIPHYFVSNYYGPDGVSRLNLQFGGWFVHAPTDPDFMGDVFGLKGIEGFYWTTYYDFLQDTQEEYHGVRAIVKNVDESTILLNETGLFFYRFSNITSGSMGKPTIKDWYLYVRCVKKVTDSL